MQTRPVMMIDEKLNSIGVKLSDPVQSVGSFIQVVITGNLAFVSGQLPIEPGAGHVPMCLVPPQEHGDDRKRHH